MSKSALQIPRTSRGMTAASLPANAGNLCQLRKTVLSLQNHASDMKRLTFIFTAALLLLFSEAAFAQRSKSEKKEEEKGGWLAIKVVNGDTLYFDSIDPIWIFPHGRQASKSMRQYYKLVYNFNKVYPYALVARKIIREADQDIASSSLTGRKRERYIDKKQKELFDVFEKPMRKMTYSQGKLLVKLVDREIGKSPYDIIKDYKNGIAARFWNGVASLFDNDLKKRYDPTGDDAVTESLVEKWENGEFPALYFSIYYEEPPVVKIPSKYR